MQDKFGGLGIGRVNSWHPTSLLKKILHESLPAMLEQDDKTAAIRNGHPGLRSRPFPRRWNDAWNQRGREDGVTVDSDATLQRH